MIKKFAILSSAVVCLALTGCGSSNSNKAEEGVQESAVVEEAGKAVATIKHGLWFSPSEERYFLFYEDKSNNNPGVLNENLGVTRDLQYGMGLGFQYTLNGADADFSFGAVDEHSPASVTFDGDNIINIEWKNDEGSNGSTETLIYVSEMSSKEFSGLYTNKEIYDQVFKHYGTEVNSQASAAPSYITLINWGKTVTAKFVRSTEDPDFDNVLATYTIDRFTGKGKVVISQGEKEPITKEVELKK